jgi:hypothetical protein
MDTEPIPRQPDIRHSVAQTARLPPIADKAVTGHEASFARTVARTFGRRFQPGSGHAIRDGERCLIGRCRYSDNGVGEAATGCFPDVRPSAAANVKFHRKRMRTFDPVPSFLRRRLLRPNAAYLFTVGLNSFSPKQRR